MSIAVERTMLKARKLLMASLIAVMATAPSAVMAAAQITKQAEQPWCGNTTTDCTPSKPAPMTDESGFPLLDPADVTKWCDHRIGGDSSGSVCTGMVQEVYDIAKYKWQITFESAHPDDTQIALKEAARLVAPSGGRDNLYAYYMSLGGCLERRLEWHRLNDPREFKP